MACGHSSRAAPARRTRSSQRPVNGLAALPPRRYPVRMEAIVVTGGRPLTGEVRVEGAKNSALKLMAASLLAPGLTRITNVPQIADVSIMADVLEGLGAHVSRTDHALEIDAMNVASIETPYELVAQMR